MDLPDDLHELVRELAHQSGRSLSEVVAELMRLGLRRPGAEPGSSARGMPQVSVGRAVSVEDVRTLDDDG